MSTAQTANGIPIKDLESEYVQIIAYGKFMSAKVTIEIDFGQPDKILNAKDTQIRDKNGKPMTFNSMIDALNFMGKNGYELLQTYNLSRNDKNYCYFILRRKKICEEIDRGPSTRLLDP